jgi:phospholipase/carboxylesterase
VAAEERDPTAEELRLEILPHVELATGAEPAGTVIWLHGLGADGWDFIPIVRELPLPATLALRFVFPHAPERAVTINNGMVMRAWYDIAMNDIARLPDERGIRASHEQVEALIARERSRGVDDARIVLAGFSQGGAMALHAGLRYPERLAGIMGLSCYLLLGGQRLAAERSAANQATAVFLAHGSQDPVVAPELGEEAKRQLQAAGYAVEWHTYSMPHSVSPQEVADIGAWLRRVL